MEEGSERFYEWIEDNKLELVRSLWEREDYELESIIEDLLAKDDTAMQYIISSIEHNKELNNRLATVLENEARKHCGQEREPEDCIYDD